MNQHRHNPFTHGPSGAIPANRIYKASKLTQMKTAQTETGGGINIDHLEPGTYTLQFSFAKLPPDAFAIGKAIPSVWAEITWTLEGQQQRRMVSVVPGLCVTGQCEGVTVTFFDKQSLLGGGANPGQEYAIQSTLSAGCRPTVNQPPGLATNALEVFNPGDDIEFFVPEDSGVISFYVSVGFFAAPTGIDTRYMVQYEQRRRAVGSLFYGDALAGGWIPLMPGADTVRLIYDAVPGAPNGYVNILWGIQG